MTSRARLFTLAARAQAHRIAELAHDISKAQAEQSTAEAMDKRLRHLMAGLAPAVGTVQAAGLRATGDLIMQLAQEADQQQTLALTRRAEVQMLQTRIATHDQRRRSIQQAADSARRIERDAAEVRIEAARPAAIPRRT